MLLAGIYRELVPAGPGNADRTLVRLLPAAFADYELIEEVARGGMGVVYKARQRSLNRTVAVKMVLSGRLAGKSELQRFRAEAETAAKLQHPNIVAIHEVGEFEGQPFFSMDYVEGQSLAEFARNEPMPAKRAAAYLRTIAEAVEYAHSKGVLHRDLKPSNILIDQNDQPRITDFGLAKRLDDSTLSTLQSSLTITGQVLGSPNFMPPEQATGDRRAVGPASDVYSLGAILYQLLTGRPPFLAETLPQTLRMVAESEPTSPRLINPGVPKDLETIGLQCLQKHPGRRYAAAGDLADELGRFLRDEPILARPVGRMDKAWRWSNRNRALASAAGSAILLLLAVTIGSPIAAFRINQERMRAETDRKKAESEAAKSQQVAQFLKAMLREVGPSVARGRDKTLLQEVLDQTAEHVGKDLKGHPEVEADLRNTLGEVYYAIGEDKQAEAMHRAALVLQRRLFGESSLAVAASKHNLGLALYAQAQSPEAIELLRKALATRRKLLGNQNLVVAESLNSLGLALADRNESGNPEAEALFREALAIRRQLLPAGDAEIAQVLNNLATTLTAEGKDNEAETLVREALAINRKLYANQHPDVAISLHTLAVVLANQGSLAEAETVQREGIALQRTLLGDKHPDLAKSLWTLARTLAYQGKYVDAEAVLREGMDMLQHLFEPSHPALDWPRVSLAQVLSDEGKTTEAEALFRQTLASLNQNHSSDARLAIKTRVGLADLLLNQVGKHAEPEQLLRGTLASLTGDQSADAWLELKTRIGLADALRGQGRMADACGLYRQGLALASRLPSSFPHRETAWRWAGYGLVYTLVRTGGSQEAESWVRQAMATNAETWVNAPGACELTIDMLAWQGKYREAEEFMTNSAALAVLKNSSSVRRARGRMRASYGAWRAAADDFVEAVNLEPENVENYHQLAPALVRGGQIDLYRHYTHDALARFADTKIPSVAERVAKDALILPASGDNLAAACRMAEVAVAYGTNHPGLNWIQVTRALAEYRQGRWSSAIKWTEAPLAKLGVAQRDAEAYLIRAMAQRQMNLTGESESALASANEIIRSKMPTFDESSPNAPWDDWVLVQQLKDEAARLCQRANP
jgi:tetratricopeptide (TPR) repeat protein/tRNA A-37 threonylcarbamoyl transferase component Bud32